MSKANEPAKSLTPREVFERSKGKPWAVHGLTRCASYWIDEPSNLSIPEDYASAAMMRGMVEWLLGTDWWKEPHHETR